MDSKYLTKEQHADLKGFLQEIDCSNDKVGKILFCSGANVGYYFKNNVFKRTSFEKVRSTLEERARKNVENFSRIDF